jgi:hypothetical protein
MVGTEGWSLRSNIGMNNIGKPRWKTLDIKSPIQGGVILKLPAVVGEGLLVVKLLGSVLPRGQQGATSTNP